MARSEAHAAKVAPIARTMGKIVNLMSAEDLQPTNHEWLWRHWMAAGSLHLIAGAPATGKTSVALSLAATLSRGDLWPDGSPARAARAVVWSGEDHTTSTLLPRLIAQGADLAKISIVGNTLEDGRARPFDPSIDLQDLKRQLCTLDNVGLLVIDPIISVVTGDSHKNAEVRRGLQPLVELAAEVGCAVLGVTHFSKGTGGFDPVERITGSLAFGALARIVMVAARSSQDDDVRHDRLLVRAKSNIGPDGDGFRYAVEGLSLPGDVPIETSCVLWGDPLEGPASAHLAGHGSTSAPVAGDGGRSAWLRQVLSAGPRRAAEVISRAAAELGCPKGSIQRTRKSMGACTEKVGFSSGSENYWYLPGQEAQLKALIAEHPDQPEP